MRPVSTILSQLTLETRAARRRRRLQAFRPPVRRYIAALSSASPAVEDLADSFPGLLFAMATGYGTSTGRERAFQLVDRGASLKEASAALGLPMWLRRIPADAFAIPLPPIPNDTDFSSVMSARVPETARECSVWLDRMTLALQIAGRELAIWIAREPRLMPPLTGDDDLQWLLAWVWASLNSDNPGHRVLRSGWSPAMSWKKARDEIAIWRKRIDLIGALAGPPRDPWFANGTVQGLEIVNLTTVQHFLDESIAMENCLDQYAAHIAYGRVRVFSIRRDGRPVADVELTVRSDEVTMPCIAQIRGPRNRRASPAVWQAVHAWLGSQTFRPLSVSPTPATASREAMRAFWQPYQLALAAAGLTPRISSPFGSRDMRRIRARGVLADPILDVLDAPAVMEIPEAEESDSTP